MVSALIIIFNVTEIKYNEIPNDDKLLIFYVSVSHLVINSLLHDMQMQFDIQMWCPHSDTYFSRELGLHVLILNRYINITRQSLTILITEPLHGYH